MVDKLKYLANHWKNSQPTHSDTRSSNLERCHMRKFIRKNPLNMTLRKYQGEENSNIYKAENLT